MPTKLSKSQFKPQVLAWLRRVEETGEDLILTDHGKPVVKIVSLVAGHGLTDLQRKWQNRVAEGEVRYDTDEGVEPLPEGDWGALG